MPPLYLEASTIQLILRQLQLGSDPWRTAPSAPHGGGQTRVYQRNTFRVFLPGTQYRPVRPHGWTSSPGFHVAFFVFLITSPAVITTGISRIQFWNRMRSRCLRVLYESSILPRVSTIRKRAFFLVVGSSLRIGRKTHAHPPRGGSPVVSHGPRRQRR